MQAEGHGQCSNSRTLLGPRRSMRPQQGSLRFSVYPHPQPCTSRTPHVTLKNSTRHPGWPCSLNLWAVHGSLRGFVRVPPRGHPRKAACVSIRTYAPTAASPKLPFPSQEHLLDQRRGKMPWIFPYHHWCYQSLLFQEIRFTNLNMKFYSFFAFTKIDISLLFFHMQITQWAWLYGNREPLFQLRNKELSFFHLVLGSIWKCYLNLPSTGLTSYTILHWGVIKWRFDHLKKKRCWLQFPDSSEMAKICAEMKYYLKTDMIIFDNLGTHGF